MSYAWKRSWCAVTLRWLAKLAIVLLHRLYSAFQLRRTHAPSHKLLIISLTYHFPFRSLDIIFNGQASTLAGPRSGRRCVPHQP